MKNQIQRKDIIMKKHDEEAIFEEPFRNWKRKRYEGKKPDKASARKQYKERKPSDDSDFLIEFLAEIETDRDLKKPIEQLLCDVQDSLQTWEEDRKKSDLSDSTKKAVSLILYSLTRMTSMNARVALSNKRLTIWIIVMTSIMTISSIIQLFINRI